MPAVKHDTTALARNLRAYFRKATARQVREGVAWYHDAEDRCRSWARETGRTIEQCASVVAALSPQIPWERNVFLAACVVLHGQYGGTFSANVDKARRALDEGFAALGGQKTSSFARNIAGDHDAVTIDRHMLRACGLEAKTGACTPNLYHACADAVRRNAKRVNLRNLPGFEGRAVGEGMSPAAYQAVVWTVIREEQVA